MKLYTPDNSELLQVTSVEPHAEGVLIQGRIMGAMPMKAVLRPEELRSGFVFLKPRLAWTLVAMLFRRAKKKR
jgi:hypothetical protein